MSRRIRISAVGLVIVTVLAVTACGDSNGGGQSTETATQHPPTSIAVATEGDSDGRDAATTRTSAFFVATAPGQDPFDKAVPTGPAPTKPPLPPSDFDADGDGLYTNDELVQAIRYRFPDVEWPKDYRVTADIIIDGLELEKYPNAGHQALAEYSIIGLFHDCAWQFTLLDAVHDDNTSLIDASLYQLKVVAMDRPLSHDTEGKEMMKDMYDRAVLGDPATLQQWVENNCEFESRAFITPSPMSSPEANTAIDTIARVERKAIR